MNIYFDTEFTGLHQKTTLISIGLAAEDGRTFYAELTDYDQGQVDDWIRENVLSHLLFDPEERQIGFTDPITKRGFTMKGDSTLVKEYLSAWLAQFDQVQMWSDCLSYDWVLFCQLWGHAFNIPKNVYYIPFDLATLFKLKGIDPDVNRDEFAEKDNRGMKHNALWDARVIRACHHKAWTVTNGT